MKKIIILLGLFISINAFSQEKINLFREQAGIIVNSTAVYQNSGSDTALANALVLAPFVRIIHKSGLGLNYSLNTLASGTGKRLFMHTASVFYEEFEKPVNLNFSYSHFFFTNSYTIPYTPISNELYGYIAYEKLWLAPAAAVSFGFGKDEKNQFQKSLNTALGVTHNFELSSNTIDDAEIAPTLFINGGNNEFYSFLKSNRYITQNTGNNGFLKRHGQRHRNRNGTVSTSTITEPVANNFTINNVEVNLYSSFAKGHFEIVPDASLYVPLNANNALDSYWQLKLDYNFGK